MFFKSFTEKRLKSLTKYAKIKTLKMENIALNIRNTALQKAYDSLSDIKPKVEEQIYVDSYAVDLSLIFSINLLQKGEDFNIVFLGKNGEKSQCWLTSLKKEEVYTAYKEAVESIGCPVIFCYVQKQFKFINK